MGNVNRFKPVRDHIETLLNAFSTRRAARVPAPANAIGGTRWLANISHELRTPLNVVIGLSDMLINEHALKLDAARRSDYAQLIHASGHHLLSLIDGILDMAKLDAGAAELQREAFAPGPAITHCVELLAHDTKQAGLVLALDLQPGLPDIVADKRAFKQILINLLSNAIKFTERGKIQVSAEVEGADLCDWGRRHRRRHCSRRPPVYRGRVFSCGCVQSATSRRNRARTVDREGFGPPAWRRGRVAQPRG